MLFQCSVAASLLCEAHLVGDLNRDHAVLDKDWPQRVLSAELQDDKPIKIHLHGFPTISNGLNKLGFLTLGDYGHDIGFPANFV